LTFMKSLTKRENTNGQRQRCVGLIIDTITLSNKFQYRVIQVIR
jgi:hypothetical protein